MTHEEILIIGNEAERIMQSEVFQNVLKEIEEEWTSEWASGYGKTTHDREDLFFRMQGLLAFKQKIISKLDSKRVSKDHIEKLQKRAANAA
jgi:hypothetical protein